MNGVIVNDEPLHTEAFKAVMRDRGQILTDVQYKQYFAGRTDKDGFIAYMAAIGQDFNLGQLMQEKARAYLGMAQGTLKPYSGIVECVRALHQAGLPLALVTGSLRIEAEAVLAAFGMTAYFKAVVAADNVRAGKPDPEGYLKGSALLHVRPQDCVVVEDTPSGIRAAKAAGMSCVAVSNTHVADELKGADKVVARLDATSFAT